MRILQKIRNVKNKLKNLKRQNQLLCGKGNKHSKNKTLTDSLTISIYSINTFPHNVKEVVFDVKSTGIDKFKQAFNGGDAMAQIQAHYSRFYIYIGDKSVATDSQAPIIAVAGPMGDIGGTTAAKVIFYGDGSYTDHVRYRAYIPDDGSIISSTGDWIFVETRSNSVFQTPSGGTINISTGRSSKTYFNIN
jgi:hypothetical protein